MNFSDFRISTTTGTSDARAELPNPDGALRPGQFVRVALTGAQRVDAILVPQRAVLEGPQGKFVFVANAESKVEIHPVEVGDWTGDSWVINKGLQAGDRVIVDGVVKIGPGAPVKTVDANAPKTASVTTPEAGKAQTGKAQK
jgi:membrane fusion protein (multidrug efflux system)